MSCGVALRWRDMWSRYATTLNEEFGSWKPSRYATIKQQKSGSLCRRVARRRRC
ncbi:hypothetical protein Hdeb2414_s0014g00436161 [Helianthus debilis subsp. tardiflorus]